MNKNLESYALSVIEECACFEDLYSMVQDKSKEDVSRDCLNIWNEYWSKDQECCPDCD
jgi:hypothetical protein